MHPTPFRRHTLPAGGLPALSALAAAVAALAALSAPAAHASSHREAPSITGSPKVDATDLYLFNSYEAGRGDFVTLIANYQPLQDPYGGPNYFKLDPNALYEIHIDNNGDAREDITFQFQFKNNFKNIKVPVGNQMVGIPLTQAGMVSQPQRSGAQRQRAVHRQHRARRPPYRQRGRVEQDHRRLGVR